MQRRSLETVDIYLDVQTKAKLDSIIYLAEIIFSIQHAPIRGLNTMKIL
jgi:hypothetical protein